MCHVDNFNWGNREEDMTDVSGVTYVHFCKLFFTF